MGSLNRDGPIGVPLISQPKIEYSSSNPNAFSADVLHWSRFVRQSGWEDPKSSSSPSDLRKRMTVICLTPGSPERPIYLEVQHNPSHRPCCRCHRYNKTRKTQHLQTNPPFAPLLYLLLRNVHLNRKINRQRPKTKRPQNPNNIVKKWEQHRYHRRQHNKRAPENIEFVSPAREGDLPGDEVAVIGPSGRGPFLYKGK
ncbi:peptide chain release factor 1 [Striga asiatica]|uniref:Peptide chain release factor 1 n=1 Tax=Striga asiatica TaxID=4170 RepID=A0A5A7QXJ3_STRAF|nr:peptide chain release factor 1 [Striga asiatica]